ncbi:MAG: hypothetical protein JXR49_12430 [Acidobacteria bacterium]|nr:hypothetical protein [Acidobacteriota bacterium]
MSKSIDRGIPALPEQSGEDIVGMLIKMQRQLLFLEKKIDSLMHHLQEKPYRENSSTDRHFARKSYSKPLSISGRPRRHGSEKQREQSEEKGSDQAFYSKFRKTNGRPGAGPRKKPFHHKQKKRKQPL